MLMEYKEVVLIELEKYCRKAHNRSMLWCWSKSVEWMENRVIYNVKANEDSKYIGCSRVILLCGDIANPVDGGNACPYGQDSLIC